MNIAIIGTGNVGGALAESWARAGHSIRLGVRDPERFKGSRLIAHDRITVHPIRQASHESEVILLATPPSAARSVIEALGDVSGKVVIDATNAIRDRPEGYDTVYAALRALAPNADVVKCFNSTGFENMKDPAYPTGALDMFMAGHSKKGKDVASRLAIDAGFAACRDFGGDGVVPLLEQFAMCWINLAIIQGQGRNIGFKLVRR